MQLTELFTAIADAIRTKKGTTDLINAVDFPDEILSITSSESDTTSYTPIQYIQGTGTQAIDTGYTPNHNTKLEITLSDNALANGNSTIFGETWGHNRFLVTTSGGTYRYFYNGEVQVSEIAGKHKLTFYRSVIIVDGGYLSNNASINSNVTFTNPLSIFRSTSGGGFSAFRLYECKIYDNGELVREFIPVRDKDGFACLYDKVNEKFYYNSGTGTFIAGPEI